MAQTQAGVGVLVDAPSGVAVSPRKGTGGPGPGLGVTAPSDASDLGRALGAAGLQLAADFDLRPSAPGLGAALAAGSQPVKVKVDVKGDESALLLVETQGGVFAWSYPQARVHKASPGLGAAPAAGGGPATLIFEMSAGSPAAGPAFGLKSLKGSPVWDWVVDKAIGPVRTRVLKFVVGKVEDAIVDHIEGNLMQGLTSLADDDPAKWRADGTPPTVRAGAGPRRILLMVHGTFSTTTGSFGALTTTPEGRAFLTAARTDYDAVLGFDHRTLADGADKNAEAILAAVSPLLPAGSTIDAVAYSRGGLVYRAFAETLLPAHRPDLKLGKAAFVACTNGGTHLAEPKNWEALVDLYTNIIMASSRIIGAVTGAGALSPVVTQSIETVASFVKSFAVVGVTDRRAPGLADMEPGSTLGKGLNTATAGTDALADYFAITSNFKPTFDPEKGLTKELEQMLLDKVTNRLFQTDNDLVVDTASMTTFGSRESRLKDVHVFRFGDVEDVYHTVYFATPQAAGKLQEWLTA
jgi:hypothetical protein